MRSLATSGRTSPSPAPLLINKSLQCSGCKQQMTDDITLSKTKLTLPHLCVVWRLQILCLEECEEGGENSRDFSSINSTPNTKIFTAVYHTFAMDYSFCYPLEKGSTAFIARLAGSARAFSP